MTEEQEVEEHDESMTEKDVVQDDAENIVQHVIQQLKRMKVEELIEHSPNLITLIAQPVVAFNILNLLTDYEDINNAATVFIGLLVYHILSKTLEYSSKKHEKEPYLTEEQ